jgi:hypothetical protein
MSDCWATRSDSNWQHGWCSLNWECNHIRRRIWSPFLITSIAPITTESIDDALLKSATILPGRVIGHANRLRRNVPLAIERADEHELAWLAHSSGLLVALIKFRAEGNTDGMAITLDLLKEAGWSETLLRVSGRIEASLRSNFPPAEGPLSRTAARLLRGLREIDRPD